MDGYRLDGPRLREGRNVGERALADDLRRSLFDPLRESADVDGDERVRILGDPHVNGMCL